MYLFLVAVGMAAFWLLLSGFWDNTLLLTFGALSVVLTVWVTARMHRYDRLYTHFKVLINFPWYWVWLTVEVVKANVAVLKCIWLPRANPISPAIRRVPLSQTTPVTRATYANSITLTPGTVSIDLEKNHILVHGLQKESIDDLEGGYMDKRIKKLEQ